MSKKKKAEDLLVPRLRFPKFRAAEEWLCKPMEELYSFKGTVSLSRDRLNYEQGDVKNIHYGDIHTKFSASFDVKQEIVPFIDSSIDLSRIDAESYCAEGDIVFADTSEDLQAVGKAIELVNLNGEKLLAGSHTILARQKYGELIVGFGGQLFQADSIRGQVQKEAQGAKVLGISTGRLSKVRVTYPRDKAEQKQISSCLASVDELIRGEGRKLELLTKHREGLVRRLFPRHGETTPQLRFRGQRYGKAWVTQRVSSILRKVSRSVAVEPDGIYSQIGIRSHGKGIFHKHPVSGEELGEKRVFWVEQGALVLNIVFAWEQAVATTSPAEQGMIASHRFPMYVPKEGKCDVEFLKYLFLTQNGKHLLGLASPGGAGRNKTLGQKEFEGLELLVPPTVEEQATIAKALRSVDNLLSFQSRRIKALISHKQGLMAQLFPNIRVSA
jgi:type I restriction enzyme, S subunit